MPNPNIVWGDAVIMRAADFDELISVAKLIEMNLARGLPAAELAGKLRERLESWKATGETLDEIEKSARWGGRPE